MSLLMAESCKDWLTSYVLGDDIVPRLSLESMEHLRADMLVMIARIKVTKHKAMNSRDELDMLVYPKNISELPQTEFSKQLVLFHEHKIKKRMEIEEDEVHSSFVKVRLYPPGKIVHLVSPAQGDDPPRRGCCVCSKVESVVEHHAPCSVRWAHRDDLAEVRISSHFVKDHKSGNVLRELELVAQDFGLSAPFLPEQSAM